jgi:hypothetical protein
MSSRSIAEEIAREQVDGALPVAKLLQQIAQHLPLLAVVLPHRCLALLPPSGRTVQNGWEVIVLPLDVALQGFQQALAEIAELSAQSARSPEHASRE